MNKCPVPATARSKGTATLEPELTKHSRLNIYLGIHRQTSMATFRPTCLSRLLTTKELWVNDQLDAQLRCIKVYYCNPVHVSSNTVLIIRRSNCINTASGIVLSASDRPVCRLRRNLHTGRSLRALYQMLY